MRIIGGTHKNREIALPKGASNFRPTASRVREALFNICQTDIQGARFLDLFAGTGGMGLEALSRGAEKVCFMERDRMLCESIKKNLQQLGWKTQGEVISGDLFRGLPFLLDRGLQYDLIYIDPPYGEADANGLRFGEKVIQWLDQHSLLAEGGRIFLEDYKVGGECLETFERLELVDHRKVGDAELQEFRRGGQT